ncbi:MAG TPA: murein biosynthesis integral membrane protein MurJ [Thermodesulfovibrionales bacterium]|nr:murein biosynthesis integral membrane protein MurJ [Thermodesulfovibrionales bacterium]
MKKSPAAIAVAIGILLSRITGLVRERVFAFYLGNSDAAGAFRAALRIPNLLQNLFGEGVLSASFIPVYAKLLAEGKEEEAGVAASVVLSLLVAIAGLLVIIGVTFSRPLIAILAPGFHGAVRELTIKMVAIMFPGTGLLVLSAWCLGVLNSHRKFFLSYVAPVLWNLAIIAILVGIGGHYMANGHVGQERLVIWVAWSTVVGAILQWGVQFPRAMQLNGVFAFSLRTRTEAVQKIITNFTPAVITRGVVQLSAYIDQVLASYLGPASVAAMAYAQTIYMLPVSLFGMAISTAALTDMSRATGTREEIVQALETKLTAGSRKMAFLVIPSAVAFIVLGDVIAATLFQTGHFGRSDSRFVWFILAGSAVGLVATTQSRLFISAFWSLGNTRTPLRIACFRVALTAIFGCLAVFPLRSAFGIDVVYCAAALTASAGIAGWIELLLFRYALALDIGRLNLGGQATRALWGIAIASGAIALGVKSLIPGLHVAIRGMAVLGVYGLLYIGGTLAAGIPEAVETIRTVRQHLLGTR